ncbi:hypothetical protein ABF87_04335 [Nitrosomonas sp. JL21]|uniref:hypothetical protein n=1 Tax=Nitrosomonas sp. JL21 TaxID=153949 RepID=UPI00136BA437|nr:hypothetical protein [Nitrosomonas sp. JL21]MBL8497331.1 hypothetical protein [Nitrosomonas sp.]MXS77201.1 hypothetical protein [Nitrosomonas sp. JL21]
MKALRKRIDAIEQRSRPSPYPEGWPVLVSDEYTDEQIEALKIEIGRVDIYRENDPAWVEMFIG